MKRGLRSAWWCALLASVGAFHVPALAAAPEADKAKCLGAYEQAQRLKNQGDLLGAREGFELCRSERCPSLMHADCDRWFREVETSTPSVVFFVRSSSGVEPTVATVSIDGKIRDITDGRAVELNPGKHLASCEAPGHRPAKRRFMLSEGEKLRAVVVTLESWESVDVSSLEPAPKRSPSFAPFLIAGSFAVASGGAFAFFGLRARAADRKLDDCVPNCSPSRVDAIRRDYLLANVSAASLAASSVLAAVFLGTGLASTSDDPAARLQPVLGLDHVGIEGRF